MTAAGSLSESYAAVSVHVEDYFEVEALRSFCPGDHSVGPKGMCPMALAIGHTLSAIQQSEWTALIRAKGFAPARSDPCASKPMRQHPRARRPTA
jgi:hypothetical protein